ncbi:MAG: STAS domain-containing protein [Gammaproteobacteria bacterium]|nr:STAS domain-containing protein [Gammaproteobacteria bacterium]
MTGQILAGKQADVFVVRCVGDVRLGMGTGMDRYFERVLASGECASIVVDLRETESIDSTSLGSLAKLSIAAQKALQAPPTLVSTNPDVTRVLKTMGFHEVFSLVEHPVKAADVDAANLQDKSESGSRDEAEMRRYVIDVHKALVSINGKNRETFKDLMAGLEEEV